MEELEFMECESCSQKPGSPTLCPSCLHNRRAIDKLSLELKKKKKLIKKIHIALAEQKGR